MKTLTVLDARAAFVDVGSEHMHVSVAGDEPAVFGTVTSRYDRGGACLDPIAVFPAWFAFVTRCRMHHLHHIMSSSKAGAATFHGACYATHRSRTATWKWS
jgi:hypothetical protein